ncbi:LysE family transporter, partial [Streptococcus pyogenes]|uniref:LysE family transporter n=1 Tax=Streptococcus pyogenes TaxID=1314 RepID=UPI003DA04E4D
MSIQELLAFFVFSVTAAVTPGPANILVLSAGLRSGVRGGIPTLSGIVLGMGLLVGASAAGLGALLLANPGAASAMRWAGALVLLWLAWKIGTAPALRKQELPDPVGLWRAMLVQW